VVGLIDTGLQSMGSQLDQFIVKSISVTGEPAAASAGPTHATSMAQTILRAVSQQTKSTSVKILAVDVYGSSGTATTWNVALGIKAAVDGGATVLNMSLGGTSDSTILDSIVKQALDKGVVIFAAAGNQPVDTPTYPAATLPADMPLLELPSNRHRSAGPQADPQGIAGRLRVGGDPARQVLQSSSDSLSSRSARASHGARSSVPAGPDRKVHTARLRAQLPEAALVDTPARDVTVAARQT